MKSKSFSSHVDCDAESCLGHLRLNQSKGEQRMFAKNRYAQVLLCLAGLGMLVSPILGASPINNETTKPKVLDVRLTEAGKLVGQIVNSSGVAKADAQVVLTSGVKSLVATKSDKLGRFMLPVPKSGVYRVAIADQAFTVRAWQSKVAPPNAKLGMLCIADDTIVRGQCAGCGEYTACEPGCGVGACGAVASSGSSCCGRAMALLTNPVVFGLGVATAIALPIALDDDDDDDSSGAGAGGAGEPTS